MNSNILYQRSLSKKKCINCLDSPQNILMLACDHSICISCTYNYLNHMLKGNILGQVKYQCPKCQQITYFDRQLINQIEINFSSFSKRKYFSIEQNKQLQETKKHESFIQKMKKLYFSENLPNNSFSKQIYCNFHSKYQLVYFCKLCNQLVCSQCLLRGQHKNHENEGLMIILQNYLPRFINEWSQNLLCEIKNIQRAKQIECNQISNRFNQINGIRQQAQKYFNQIRKNIHKEQHQIYQRCDLMINKIKLQQKQIESIQDDTQSKLTINFKKIKSLKTVFDRYLKQDCSKNINLQIKKQLVHDFIQCQTQILLFFNQQKLQKESQSKLRSQSNAENQINSDLNSLNAKISQSIESIRQSMMFQSFSGFKQLNQKNQIHSHRENIKKLNIIDQNIGKDINKDIVSEFKKDKYKKKTDQSYCISTQNSNNGSRQLKRKTRNISPSISPYKAPKFNQKYYYKKSKKQQSIKKNSKYVTSYQLEDSVDYKNRQQNILCQQKSLKEQLKSKICQDMPYRKQSNIQQVNSKSNKKSIKKQSNSKVKQNKNKLPHQYFKGNTNLIHKLKMN